MRVRARQARLIEVETAHPHVANCGDSGGGWPQVCVCDMCIFMRLLANRSRRTCGSHDDAGFSYGRLVSIRSQMFDEFPDDRLVIFLSGG